MIFGNVCGAISFGLPTVSDPVLMGYLLAAFPIGLAAGCAVIYFGKIRPKAR